MIVRDAEMGGNIGEDQGTGGTAARYQQLMRCAIAYGSVREVGFPSWRIRGHLKNGVKIVTFMPGVTSNLLSEDSALSESELK